MIAIEQVFVVPRKDLFPKGAPHGFVAGAEPYLASIRRHGFFVERPAAEENPALKQVIPYAVLCCRDEIFLFTRRGGGGEKRLYGLRSVGVGGHINPIDAPRRPIDAPRRPIDAPRRPIDAPRRPIDGAMHGDDLVWEGLRRELLEEVGLQPGPPITLAGILNNDRTPVGTMHVGLVAAVDLSGGGKDLVEVREPDRMTGRFIGRRELLALHESERDSFEGWSALLLDRLDEVMPWERRPGSSTTSPKATPTSTT